jgi:two-component system cell cycle sensor histidine kinase/response regulator CckA
LTTILVVEGELNVRTMIAKALEREGFFVLAADSGAKAISLSRAHPGDVDLLLSDVAMRDMDGATLARELRRGSPELPVILMSGGSDPLSQVVARPARFLSKPFPIANLTRMAKSLLGVPASRRR